MRGQQTLFASARTEASRAAGSTDNWSTPQKFYDLLHKEFGFTLDPCADASNAKAEYFDEATNGLIQDWGDNVCFVNFPYSQAKAWAAKCIDAAQKGATVVVLCAARTDTKWWQSLALAAEEVRFILGRLKFTRSEEDLNDATNAWFDKKRKVPTPEIWKAKRDEIENQGAAFPSSVMTLHPGLNEEHTRMSMWKLPAEVRR